MSQQAGQEEDEEEHKEEGRTRNILWNSRMKRRVGGKVLMLLSVCLLVVVVAVMLAACHLTLCSHYICHHATSRGKSIQVESVFWEIT